MPDNPEMFAIVPVSGKPPADAIVSGGPLSEIMEYIGGSVARNEKEAQIAKAQRDAEETEKRQAEVHTHALQMFSDGITRLGERLDQFEVRKQARADQLQREKEEAETARIEALLAALPDPDAPDTATHPAHPAPGEHTDDGDFEAINPPPETEKHNPEHRASGDTITGTLPAELEKSTPPETGEFSSTAPAPSPFRTPASIGLN
jgi:hypothetical protein